MQLVAGVNAREPDQVLLGVDDDGGEDSLRAQGGDDFLEGGHGDDTVDGGPGDDLGPREQVGGQQVEKVLREPDWSRLALWDEILRRYGIRWVVVGPLERTFTQQDLMAWARDFLDGIAEYELSDGVDEPGFFGDFGGKFVPETLMAALDEFARATDEEEWVTRHHLREADQRAARYEESPEP